jgi:anti-sigma regulatory factor (Ser/Thr protein kinase)
LNATRVVHVAEVSEVSAARRVAQQCAEATGLGEQLAARAALVTTELGTNLIKHGGGGSILFGSDESRDKTLTIIAIDKGRGISNVAAASRDGYSTAGSPGNGLGAIARSTSEFDIYTLADKGTAILCRVGSPANGYEARPPRMVVGGICVPKRGEEENGDGWTAIVGAEVVTIAVADGLGHGPSAALASTGVLRVIRERDQLPLTELMEEAHGATRATRGSAVGIVRILPASGRLDFVGVGNIAGTITNEEGHRKTVSLPGIVGHDMRRVQLFSYPWTAASILVMHSDGISTSWNLNAYPGLSDRDPMLIAAVLFRDYCRGTDDATVVVAKATQ